MSTNPWFGGPRAFGVTHAGRAVAVAVALALGAIFTAAGDDDRRSQTTVLSLARSGPVVVIELAPVADGPPPNSRPESAEHPAPIPALSPGTDPQPRPPPPAEAPAIAPVPDPPAANARQADAPPGPRDAALRVAMVVPPAPGAAPRPPIALPAIAIVIDDVGLDKARSRRAIALPGPLTLAVFPFAAGSAELAAAGRDAGHEVIAHLPMEAMEAEYDPGPMALMTAQEEPELVRRLRWHLDRYDGFSGASNHMGSRFTADARRMDVVLRELKARGMFWFDSRTNGRSVGECRARQLGVDSTGRDVFLDNDSGVEAVMAELRRVEQIARKHGRAVAIGHPRDGTLVALREWLPRMRRQGFEFRPVSAMLATAAAACKGRGAAAPTSGTWP